MKKVTGIGGIFFTCADPQKMNEWYEKHLGIPVAEYGKFVHILDPEGNSVELFEPPAE